MMSRAYSALVLVSAVVSAAPTVTYRSEPTEPVVFGITDIGEVGLEVDEDHDTVEDSFSAAYSSSESASITS